VSQIKLTASQLKSVQEYCKLNNIEDVDKFITKCYTEGFNIKKYGLIGDDSEKIGGIEEKQVEIEVIREIRVEVPVEVVKYVEVPVEIIKEVEVIQYVDREVIKEVPVEIIKEKIVNVIQEVPVSNLVYIYDKKDEEVVPNIDKIGDEPKSNDKVLLLQETLQKLRKELTDKNSRITELEEINKRLESIKISQGAVYLKGSNISETL
jgi:hypothetical protein